MKISNKQALKLYAKISSLAYAQEPQMEYYNLGFDTIMTLNEKGIQAFLLKNRMAPSLHIIAIRGSDEPRDFYRNGSFLKVDTAYGSMHYGFYRGAKVISQWCKEYFQSHPGLTTRIYVGHSLGGALALASHIGFDRQSDAAVTFGAPMIADHEFLLQKSFSHTRVRNCNDIVTRVPPSKFKYKHHGELIYLDFYGNIKNKISIFDTLRAKYKAWKKKQLFDGFYDHDLQEYIKKLS